jgi:hypothetical protein
MKVKKSSGFIIIGDKKIKPGKDALKSTSGGSFSVLIKSLKDLSKKDIYESSIDNNGRHEYYCTK